MNISAMNCTPIKPQVAFGNGDETPDVAMDVTDVQKVLDLTNQLKDSVELTKPEDKTKLETAVSTIGALAATFVLGKVAAAKVLTAFPNIATKIGAGASKAAHGAKAAIGKINLPEKLTNSKIAEGAKKLAGSKAGLGVKSTADKFAKKVAEYAQKQGADGLFKTAAGIGSMAILGGQISKIDGNEDGVADIAQKNVNAYKNAIHSIGIVGEIAETLS